jgi:hypothetical protein
MFDELVQGCARCNSIPFVCCRAAGQFAARVTFALRPLQDPLGRRLPRAGLVERQEGARQRCPREVFAHQRQAHHRRTGITIGRRLDLSAHCFSFLRGRRCASVNALRSMECTRAPCTIGWKFSQRGEIADIFELIQLVYNNNCRVGVECQSRTLTAWHYLLCRMFPREDSQENLLVDKHVTIRLLRKS